MCRFWSSAALALWLLSFGPAGRAWADQWLVYMGGDVASIEEGWTERRGQVLFNSRSGSLLSVPAHDVDLAASSFITWQLDGRMRKPPRASLSPTEDAPEGQRPCTPGRLMRHVSSETLEVETEAGRELVHLACLDTPETGHRLAELSWFGRASLNWMQIEARTGESICLTEHEPARRDAEGHRVLYVRLSDGRDYTAAAIASGYGLVRPGLCDRAAAYRAIEDRAIEAERGLWGARAEQAALAAVGHSVGIDSGVSSALPPRRRSGGG
jgi:endonuclease YncB( thermonuclease family)